MISVDQWRDGGATFEWRGHRVFYRVEGAGEPVLLVHGFPTSSWDWAALWPELAARYRVMTLDMIGFGLSAKPRAFAYSIFAQADLFEAFIAREGVGAYRMVAHDYGDTVAQELLARQRARTPGEVPRATAVCLLNGGLFPETHRALATQRLLASPLVGPLLARAMSYRAFAGSMRRIWGRTPASDAELRAMWRLLVADGGRAVLPKLLGYMAERRQHRARWVAALADAPAPVRVINGSLDPISGAHMVARYREVVARPDVVALPDAGHYPQVEAPAAVLAAVLAHFNAHG